MTTAEREDLYDRMYGEDDEDLSPLERGLMSLRVGGGEDGDFDRAMAFSAINAREAKIKVDALYDFLKDYVPDSHKTKMLVNGLVRLCQRMLNSPACRRQLRFEVEEARAKYWLGRVGKQGEEHIEAADRLLDRWGACDLLQITIRTRRIRHGLEAVEGERPRWYTAKRKKELLEELAARLPSAAHEYFRCRLEQYNIQRERAEDRARGIPEQDYSELIKKIQDGTANAAEVLSSAPWPFKEAFDVCVQDASEENPHWKHNERMASASALGRKQPRSRWSRREGDDDVPA